MHPLRSRGFWVVYLTVLILLGLIAAKPAEKPDPIRIAHLIKQLGHDEYIERENAGKALEELGEPVLPALREAVVTNENPEIRARSQRLIRSILWGNRKSKSTGLEMIPIASGEFAMGSLKSEGYRRLDEHHHQVRITRTFLIGIHEVTQEHFQKVMERNPSWFSTNGDGKDRVKGMNTDRFPVESVTWFDAVEFCNKLGKLDGYEPYYELEDVKRKDGGIIAAKVTVLGGSGYRLPTEAEWEYACRAGSPRPYHFGFSNTGREANLKPSPDAGGYGGPPQWAVLNRPTTVGSYKPSGWNLYDMHGNVGEWCHDWYDKDYYANSPEKDPKGPNEGTQRVVRSGSWMVSEGSCRSAARLSLAPDERKDYVGFRVARSP